MQNWAALSADVGHEGRPRRKAVTAMLALGETSHTVLHVVIISSPHFLLMLKLLLLSALLVHLGVVELEGSRVLEGKPAYLT